MDIAELKQKTQKELHELLAENRKKIMNFRFDKAAGKLKKHHQVSEVRQETARILTLLKKENKQQ